MKSRGHSPGTPGSTAIVRDLVMVTSIAAAACLVALGSKSLWLDEATSVSYALLGPRRVLGDIAVRDPNMSLYYALLSLWVKISGTGEAAVRLPSALCAMLGAPLTYLIGLRLFGRPTGLLAGVLQGLNAFAIEYGQTARGYTLFMLLILLATWLLILDLEQPSRAVKVGYVVAIVSAFHVHYFAGLAVAAHMSALLVIRGRKAFPRDSLAAGVAIAVLCAPMMAIALREGPARISWLRRPGAGDLGELFVRFAGGDPLFLAILAGASVGAVVFARRDGKSTATIVLAAWLVVPICVAFAVSQVQPMFSPRDLIGTLPALVLLASAGLTRIRPLPVSIVGAGLGLVLSLIGVRRWQQEPALENWRQAVAFVRESAAPGDGVVFVPFYVSTPFEYYARSGGEPKLENRSQEAATDGPRVWLVVSPAHVLGAADELAALRRSLSRTHRLRESASYAGVDVQYYVR